MTRGAVFLDRDGTIIRERHYLSDPEHVELIPGTGAALRRLRELGLKLVVVTNQSAVGRGLFDQQRLDAIHQRLQQLLAQEGVHLDGIYACPHAPEDGCACRKPSPGLLERAMQDLQLDPSACCVVGDKRCDLDAGRRIGAMTLLVRTGYGAELARQDGAAADHVVDDVRAAVPAIERWFHEVSPAGASVPPAAALTDVVILCGGRGQRLGNLTTLTPKPLLPVGSRPFLAHLLQRLHEEGFRRILLAAHYLAEQFAPFIEAHRRLLPQLELLIEPAPLGTGGALRHAANHVRSETFVALNGDSWVRQPLLPVLAAHRAAQAEVTMVAVRSTHVEGQTRDKDVIVIGPQQDIRGFARGRAAQSDRWVNAGCYVLQRRAVQRWPQEAFLLEARLPSLVAPERSRVFYCEDALLDIGTPACYAHACDMWHETA